MRILLTLLLLSLPPRKPKQIKWRASRSKDERKQRALGSSILRFELLCDPNLDGARSGAPIHEWAPVRYEFEAATEEESLRWLHTLAPHCRHAVGFFGGALEGVTHPSALLAAQATLFAVCALARTELEIDGGDAGA